MVLNPELNQSFRLFLFFSVQKVYPSSQLGSRRSTTVNYVTILGFRRIKFPHVQHVHHYMKRRVFATPDDIRADQPRTHVCVASLREPGGLSVESDSSQGSSRGCTAARASISGEMGGVTPFHRSLLATKQRWSGGKKLVCQASHPTVWGVVGGHITPPPDGGVQALAIIATPLKGGSLRTCAATHALLGMLCW